MPKMQSVAMPPLPAELAAAITAAPLSGLGEGEKSADLAQWITAHPQLGFSQPASDRMMADACRSGLWLLAGDLHRSHSLSQAIESREGSFWHGIMHRREGDFGNARYWFRQVGDHPVLQAVAAAATDDLRRGSRCLDADRLNPLALVDACQQAVERGGELAAQCRQIQWLEWQALFAHCLAAAWGTAAADPPN